MRRFESPIDDAIVAGKRNLLVCVVYCALNTVVDYYEDQNMRKELEEFGEFHVTEQLIRSSKRCLDRTAPDGHSSYFVDPWIAQHLYRLDHDDIAYIVGWWLARLPLDPRINPIPQREAEKLERLHELRRDLNR